MSCQFSLRICITIYIKQHSAFISCFIEQTFSDMTDYKLSSWSDLHSNVGLQEVNELDERTNCIFKTLRDIMSVSYSNTELCNKIQKFKNEWYPATDQYERTSFALGSIKWEHQACCWVNTMWSTHKRTGRYWSDCSYTCTSQRTFQHSKKAY